MVYKSEACSFRTVSEIERGLTRVEDFSRLLVLARDILGCGRRRECGDADCCTILGASLLAQYGPRFDP